MTPPGIGFSYYVALKMAIGLARTLAADCYISSGAVDIELATAVTFAASAEMSRVERL